ncbi:MAG: hypothetical protein KDM63_15550 [Verrucomicrobiae bacterium]|nr:hypothetical protein [Verrucomicrobiae bacterium]
MFASAVQANKVLTWVLRFVGFLLMAIGLGLIARPLKVMADVVPMAGRVVGMGIGLFAFILAGIGSTLTISVAWITYRPLIGIPVLALTVFFIWWLVSRLRKAKTPVAEPAPPPLA